MVHITKQQSNKTKTVFIINAYYEGKQTIDDVCVELIKREIESKEGKVYHDRE